MHVMPLLGPSMRISLQLVQGTAGGLVLLAGCRIVFGKRAGIVLLHSGVGLMMFSELLVGTTAVESQMHIVEGGHGQFRPGHSHDRAGGHRLVRSGETTRFVIPQRLLVDRRKDGEKIEHAGLPFDIKVVKFLQNSQLDPVKAGIEIPLPPDWDCRWSASRSRPVWESARIRRSTTARPTCRF